MWKHKARKGLGKKGGERQPGAQARTSVGERGKEQYVLGRSEKISLRKYNFNLALKEL